MYRYIEAIENSRDIFIRQPPEQPKKEIIQHLAANGIPTLTVYESDEEAYDLATLPFIRGEHPQDYRGMSDALNSMQASEDFRDEIERAKNAGADWFRVLAGLGDTDHMSTPLGQFAEIMGYDSLYDRASYSVWEYAKGDNYTVHQDPVRAEIYHVSRLRPVPGERSHSFFGQYNIVDNEFTAVSSYGKFSVSDIRHTVGIARSALVLEAFVDDHSYISELVFTDEGPLMAQIRRGRDKQQAPAKLDSAYFGRGWHEANLVLGATNGIEMHNSMLVQEGSEERRYSEHIHEFSAVIADSRCKIRTAEAISQVAEVVVPAFPKSFIGDLPSQGHSRKSLLFKPKVSFLAGDNFGDFLESIPLSKESILEVASDGLKAYLRMI